MRECHYHKEEEEESGLMYVVWLSPGGFGGFTGIFRDAEICPGFPPPKAALVTVASGGKGTLGSMV